MSLKNRKSCPSAGFSVVYDSIFVSGNFFVFVICHYDRASHYPSPLNKIALILLHLVFGALSFFISGQSAFFGISGRYVIISRSISGV